MWKKWKKQDRRLVLHALKHTACVSLFLTGQVIIVSLPGYDWHLMMSSSLAL